MGQANRDGEEASEVNESEVGSQAGSQTGSQFEEKDPFTVAQDLWLAEGARLDALKALREKQAGQLLGGLGGFKELNTPEATIEIRNCKDDKPVDIKGAEPTSSASAVFVPRQTYAVYRVGMANPETGESLSPVSLSFELEPDPGPDFGRVLAGDATSVNGKSAA